MAAGRRGARRDTYAGGMRARGTGVDRAPDAGGRGINGRARGVARSGRGCSEVVVRLLPGGDCSLDPPGLSFPGLAISRRCPGSYQITNDHATASMGNEANSLDKFKLLGASNLPVPGPGVTEHGQFYWLSSETTCSQHARSVVQSRRRCAPNDAETLEFKRPATGLLLCRVT
jgi:hypothetical protein